MLEAQGYMIQVDLGTGSTTFTIMLYTPIDHHHFFRIMGIMRIRNEHGNLHFLQMITCLNEIIFNVCSLLCVESSGHELLYSSLA